MEMIILKLYIAGQTQKSNKAIQDINDICNKYLKDRYKLTIVDVLKEPEKAEKAKIMAIPTLIKEAPLAVKRIIGDLSDKEKAFVNLDIDS